MRAKTFIDNFLSDIDIFLFDQKVAVDQKLFS